MAKFPFEIENSGNSKVAKFRIITAITFWREYSRQFTMAVDRLIGEGYSEVELYLNTPGGSMFDANEIGNQFNRFRGEKRVKLGAMCASAGTIISTYFDKIESSKNTQYMIHNPKMKLEAVRESDFDSSKKLYVNLREDMLDRYEARTNMSREDLSTMLEQTTWMNAKECLEKGFVDSINGEKAALPENYQESLENLGFSVPENVLANWQQDVEPQSQKQMNALAQLLITSFTLQGVTSESDAASIVQALQAQRQDRDTQITRLTAETQVLTNSLAEATTQIETLNASVQANENDRFEQLISNSLISDELKDVLRNKAAQLGYEGVEALLKTMPTQNKRVPLHNGLNQNNGTGGRGMKNSVYGRINAMNAKDK